MKKGLEPYRTCIGCGGRKPKKELLRIVYGQKSGLFIDPGQRAPGRGAYLCKELACAQKAIKRNAFSHALRQSLRVPPDFLKVFQDGL